MFYAFKIRRVAKLLLLLLFLATVAVVGINIKYPLKYWETIRENSVANGLDSAFICAVIRAESKFDYQATSHKNARGLMQLTEATANWLAEEMKLENYDFENILDPELNIKIGSYYLKKLLMQYGNYELALAAYNAGSGNVDKWLKDINYSQNGRDLHYIPFKETRNYIVRVNNNYKIYKRIIQMRKAI